MQDLNTNADLCNQTDFKRPKKYVKELLTQKNLEGVNFQPKNCTSPPPLYVYCE